MSLTKIQAKKFLLYPSFVCTHKILSSEKTTTIKDNKKSNLSKFSYTSELLMVLNFDTPFRRNQ